MCKTDRLVASLLLAPLILKYRYINYYNYKWLKLEKKNGVCTLTYIIYHGPLSFVHSHSFWSCFPPTSIFVSRRDPHCRSTNCSYFLYRGESRSACNEQRVTRIRLVSLMSVLSFSDSSSFCPFLAEKLLFKDIIPIPKSLFLFC